jgi:Tfp pilus assembly protein PilF
MLGVEEQIAVLQACVRHPGPLGPEELSRIREALGRNVSTWMRLGQHDRAVAALAQWLRIDPGPAELWALRSKAHEREGDLPAAVLALQRAVQIDPRSGWLIRLACLTRAARPTLSNATTSPRHDGAAG